MNDVTAQTGNPVIPSHPEIQARMAAETQGVPQQPAQGPQEQPQPQVSQHAEEDWLGFLDEDFQAGPSQQQQPSQQQAQPQQQPPVQQQGQPQQQQQQPGLPELSPETLEAIGRANQEDEPTQQQGQPQPFDRGTAEQQAITHLTENTYRLSEDEAKLLITEPEKVLPGLAARMHVQLAQQIGAMVGQLMPAMVGDIVQKRMASARAEQSFFQQYPALADKRFRNVVAQSLRLAKSAAGPNASRQEVMEMGALLAANRLRVQHRQQPQQQQQPPPQQQQRQQQAPYQPAVGSPGVPQTPQQIPDDEAIFAELAEDPNW